MWRVARYLLWCEVPELVEGDLNVSHHRQFLKLAAERGFPRAAVQAYAESRASVNAFRASKASELGVNPAAIKHACTAMGLYGSNGRQWLADNGLQKVDGAIQAMAAETRSAQVALWTGASDARQAIVTSKGPRDPAVTNFCLMLFVHEREDSLRADSPFAYSAVETFLQRTAHEQQTPGKVTRLVTQ